MALLIDQAWDLWMQTIEDLIPRTHPDIRFTRHRAPAKLADSKGPVRTFEIKKPSLLANDQFGPRSDGESTWYATDQWLVKLWYPETWVIDGDTTARGVDWLKTQDTIDLAEELVYNDFLASLAGSYESPQFKGSYEEGLLLVLQFRFAWQELFTA